MSTLTTPACEPRYRNLMNLSTSIFSSIRTTPYKRNTCKIMSTIYHLRNMISLYRPRINTCSITTKLCITTTSLFHNYTTGYHIIRSHRSINLCQLLHNSIHTTSNFFSTYNRMDLLATQCNITDHRSLTTHLHGNGPRYHVPATNAAVRRSSVMLLRKMAKNSVLTVVAPI